jgi:hypothetical protein
MKSSSFSLDGLLLALGDEVVLRSLEALLDFEFVLHVPFEGLLEETTDDLSVEAIDFEDEDRLNEALRNPPSPLDSTFFLSLGLLGDLFDSPRRKGMFSSYLMKRGMVILLLD